MQTEAFELMVSQTLTVYIFLATEKSNWHLERLVALYWNNEGAPNPTNIQELHQKQTEEGLRFVPRDQGSTPRDCATDCPLILWKLTQLL